MSLRFLEEASQELYRAIEYYEEKSAGLGGELLDDVERLGGLILASPEMGSPGRSGTKRVLLSRFPFVLVYVLADGVPIVVAFAHQRRKPGYWVDRTEAG